MKITVLDADTLGKDLDFSGLNELGETVIYPMTLQELVADRIADTDVVILNKVKLTESNLKDVKNLKLICVFATGYDNIDTEFCAKNGIAVCNVVGYSTDSVAQLTLSMALSLYTRLADYTEYVNSGAYSISGRQNQLEPVYHEISGKTWGIVGMGNIGRKVAQVATALGCKVIVYSRTHKEGYENVDIDTLCETADIISVHTPLTPETQNLINKERISKMKQGAVYINVARGKVNDEEAVADAVISGKIAAGIDVYSTEPFPIDHPYTKLLNCKNACLTPHMAWAAYEARVRCLDEIVENIKTFYDGGKRNRVV